MKTLQLAAAGTVVAMLLVNSAPAVENAGPGPTPKDKCPVCGMFVSKYPDWAASVTFHDGSKAWFDGAKDLFKFLADPGHFLPGRGIADVRKVIVTDYYSLRPVDAKDAFFVVGSNVFGPMGLELVSFAKRSEADDFMRDHDGKRLLRFGDVNRAVLDGLE